MEEHAYEFMVFKNTKDDIPFEFEYIGTTKGILAMKYWILLWFLSISKGVLFLFFHRACKLVVFVISPSERS